MDCLLCKIANKEISSENVIYENKGAVAVLDIHPIAPGHTLVLPKHHAENILDLPDEKIYDVFEAVKRTTEKLANALKPDGFTIGINHGRYSGQAIDHLHVHVVPRYKDDEGKSIHGVVNNPPKESLEEIRSKILSTKS